MRALSISDDAERLAHVKRKTRRESSLLHVQRRDSDASYDFSCSYAELLAAAGLILPGITRILPSLTALAAAGLMIVMSSATVLHVVRGERASAVAAAVLFALVTIAAYTRWKVQPIPGRKRA